ncbi:hypothetical protein CPJCM30710_28750 [Clostridium polyendosporum]|uniref:MtN3 and saliva related transmembrane protein n=1 Tax=Clostridium polyendosporum TaxID=69208 RepID=A0A919VFE4_9CLOT|nr:SemiSWEET transporter [Clostridium polyendosporum]GIM30209.1 hypothetical protein CPJCM30710_28750 [Clostridium polyendosporum]
MLFKILCIIAAILTTSSFIPQAVKTIKTKDTSGISFGMYSMFTTGVLLWVSYGLFIKDIAIIVANIITFIFALIILIYKIGNMKKGGEEEY